MWSRTLQHQCDPGVVYDWHEFDSNEAQDWMTVSLEYSGPSALYLFVWDADGALRLQHLGTKSGETMLIVAEPETITTETTADSGCGFSPGCVPGPFPVGVWRALVVAPATPHQTRYTVELRSGHGQPPVLSDTELRDVVWATTSDLETVEFACNVYDWDRVVERGERWYRGDLHMHTLLSDGKLTARELSDVAHQRGLDFISITEHNILTTAWVETPLLVIPGVEYTSTRGHWNAIGIRESVPLVTEHGPLFETQDGMNRLISEARDRGAVCSLNHPYLKPWHWYWDETPFDLFDTIEIVNDPTFPGNAEATELAIQTLDELWARGRKVWAVGGSDTHMLPTESYTEGGPPSIVGDPMTCVWAPQLSVESIVLAVRNGHTYITRGPELDPVIDVDGASYRPGDSLSALMVAFGEDIHVNYSLDMKRAPSGGQIRWVENGKVVDTTDVTGDGVYHYHSVWSTTEFRWLRVEVRDADGCLVAYVNPVYVG